jgi:hypothetical protein
MRIIRRLPPAPKPTRDRRDPNFDAFGHPIKALGPVKGFGDEEVQERVKDACRKRQEVARKRRATVRQMAVEGKTDVEIMLATGYKQDSVRRIINIMRNEGIDIPQRRRGMKKCKK